MYIFQESTKYRQIAVLTKQVFSASNCIDRLIDLKDRLCLCRKRIYKNAAMFKIM